MMFKHTTFQLGGPAKFFIKPKSRSNYRGFDYKEYSKSQGIIGNINLNDVQLISRNHSLFNKLFFSFALFLILKLLVDLIFLIFELFFLLIFELDI